MASSNLDLEKGRMRTPPPPSYKESVGGGFIPQEKFPRRDGAEPPSQEIQIQIYILKRNDFIRKVYIILSIQLLITFGVSVLFSSVDSISQWVRSNPWAYYAAFFAVFIPIIAIACVPSTLRRPVLGIVFLIIITLGFSYLAGTIASFYETEVVWQAIAITLAITVGLTLFSFQTKYDFTKWYGGMLVALIALLMFGLIRLFFSYNPVVETVFAAIGAILFGLFIILDTQFMLKYLDERDYLFAAINIYVDVINMFIFMLRLIGGTQ